MRRPFDALWKYVVAFYALRDVTQLMLYFEHEQSKSYGCQSQAISFL
jgi:hypothetical protein